MQHISKSINELHLMIEATKIHQEVTLQFLPRPANGAAFRTSDMTAVYFFIADSLENCCMTTTLRIKTIIAVKPQVHISCEGNKSKLTVDKRVLQLQQETMKLILLPSLLA